MTEVIAINTLPDAVTTTNDQKTILKRLSLLRIDRGPGKKGCVCQMKNTEFENFRTSQLWSKRE